jgi:hypothetical protein
VASLFRRVADSAALRRAVGSVIRPLVAVTPSAKAPPPPVLVIGCPRAGTTLLYQALAFSPELASVRLEGHVLWEAFNHPSRHGWSSNALGAEDITETERKYVYRVLRVLGGRRRFLDKTPKNCLRIAYLNTLFPDATFVFLRRRAADNVNSLMQGWRARPRFLSYRLPQPLEGLGELNGFDWSFVLVPGWRELTHAPLEEVCARQYVECNEAIVRARGDLDPARTIDVAYEDLVARPSDEIGRVYAELGFPFTDEAAGFAAALPHTPINALTPPRPEKWRDENPAEVGRILPLVAETERRLGY